MYAVTRFVTICLFYYTKFWPLCFGRYALAVSLFFCGVVVLLGFRTLGGISYKVLLKSTAAILGHLTSINPLHGVLIKRLFFFSFLLTV